MKFKCTLQRKDEVETWPASLIKVNDHGSFFEIFISSRSSIRIIIGTGEWGNFICIPDWGKGTLLSEFKDFFWNSERLRELLGDVDGVTAAVVIRDMAEALNRECQDDFY